MELERSAVDKRQIEAVLGRDEDPIAKVQNLVKLGLDEADADEVVERYQIGQLGQIFYEQLPRRDL